MWGAPSSLLPMLRLSLSVYEVDLEALQGMKPDVVLTQVQTTVRRHSYANVTVMSSVLPAPKYSAHTYSFRPFYT